MSAAPKVKRGRKKTRDVGRTFLAGCRDEPKIADLEESKLGLMIGLQFYNNWETTEATKRAWLLEYMTANRYSAADIKKVKSVHEKYIVHPYISLIRMLNRGYDASLKHRADAEEFVARLIANKDVEVEKGPKQLSPLAQYKKNKSEKEDTMSRDFAGFLDQEIDKIIDKRSVYATDFGEYIQTKCGDKKTLQRTVEHIAECIAEFEEAKKANDPYSKEAYAHLKPKDFTKLLAYLYDVEGIVKKHLEGAVVEKKRRTVRKARAKDPVKLTKTMKFKREGSGAEPKDLIGARAVLAFNDKYNIISFYRSDDTTGLTVKGSKLLNYSETKSVSKRFKSKADIKSILADLGTKKNLGDVMEFFDKNKKLFGKTDIKLTGRINEATILVKAL